MQQQNFFLKVKKVTEEWICLSMFLSLMKKSAALLKLLMEIFNFLVGALLLAHPVLRFDNFRWNPRETIQSGIFRCSPMKKAHSYTFR